MTVITIIMDKRRISFLPGWYTSAGVLYRLLDLCDKSGVICRDTPLSLRIVPVRTKPGSPFESLRRRHLSGKCERHVRRRHPHQYRWKCKPGFRDRAGTEKSHLHRRNEQGMSGHGQRHEESPRRRGPDQRAALRP